MLQWRKENIRNGTSRPAIIPTSSTFDSQRDSAAVTQWEYGEFTDMFKKGNHSSESPLYINRHQILLFVTQPMWSNIGLAISWLWAVFPIEKII